MNKFFQLPGRRMARALMAALTAGLVGLSGLMVTACGGGGVVPTTGVQARTLSSEFTSRKAVAYSPFRSGNRDTETITAAMIREDLALLKTGGFTLLRIFDSSDAVAKLLLQTIRDDKLDFKVMLGVYVASGNTTFSDAEVDRGIALAKAYPDIVLAVSVGNETMVSWSFNKIDPAQMKTYISRVRDAITQPVTTDDNWAFWAAAPNSILDVVDFAAVHTYALADSVFTPGSWDWQQTGVAANQRAAAMMNAALAKTRADFTAVRSYLDDKGFKNMPIVLGETGWKATASGGETFRAHPVNQKMFVDGLAAWMAGSAAKPTSIFYFEAFDEPWKGGDDKWGLFDVNRKARYVIQGLYPSSQWAAGSYTAADAVYYIPTTGNGTVTASRYSVYAEATTAGEARPTETPLWVGWNSPATAYAGEIISSSASTYAGHSLEITPSPESWGWGMIAALQTSAEDLSQFATAGNLNFSIRTTYPGSIEVGFLTGTVTEGSAYDVYMTLAPGQYGYQNDGAWHTVSIPISAITPHGAMAFGMTDPSKSRLDMSKVTNPFVIADRYAVTGKSANANVRVPLQVDAVYWSK